MMEDLLKAIMSGAGEQAGQSQAEGDPLADLLGGILGGGASQGAGSAGDLGDLLEGILGGGGPQRGSRAQPAGTGDMGDVLNAILGGGSADLGANSFLAPIVSGLAEKLGLPPAVAQMVVAFVIGKLMAGLTSGGSPLGAGGGGRQPAGQQGFDLDGLLEKMGSGSGLDPNELHDTGMPEELSRHTGLDRDTAALGLKEVFEMLGGALGGGQRPQRGTQGQPKPGGLDHLLDTW